MIRLLALLLLLIPSLALAQDQILAPNGEDGPSTVFNNVTGAACSTSTACSSASCELDINEGVAGGADGLKLCTETQNDTIRFSFPTPSSAPNKGTNAQTIEIIMSCTYAKDLNQNDCTGNPTFSVELYCGSSPTAVLPFSGVAITAVEQNHSTTFTYPATCAADGSDLEFQFTLGRSGGSPTNRRWAAIETLDWEVTYVAAAGGARRRVWVIQ